MGIFHTGSMLGLTWQAAEHHAAHSSLRGMGERTEKCKNLWLEIRTVNKLKRRKGGKKDQPHKLKL